MPVRLNGQLLRELIDAGGGMEAFLDRWHAADPDGTEHLSRAAAFRWINGQLPKNAERLLQLSAVLDIDPFALLSPGQASVREAAEALLEIVQSGRLVPPALQFLRPFFGRRQQWPPQIPDAGGRPRSWHVREFEHDPRLRANCYGVVDLVPLRSGTHLAGIGPRVFHFAFQHPRMFAARWLQYGFVLHHGLCSTLFHINGHTEELERRDCEEPTRVRTWFGPGPAIFRVASLHPFRLTEPRESHEPALAFPA
jgi:hypothetical protein